MWVPNNPYAKGAGVEDSEADALTYLTSLSRGVLDDELVRTYVRKGPEMLRYELLR